jgi:hypothetical protein
LPMNSHFAFQTCAIFFIEEYSKRKITFATDRSVAIAGL